MFLKPQQIFILDLYHKGSHFILFMLFMFAYAESFAMRPPAIPGRTYDQLADGKGDNRHQQGQQYFQQDSAESNDPGPGKKSGEYRPQQSQEKRREYCPAAGEHSHCRSGKSQGQQP